MTRRRRAAAVAAALVLDRLLPEPPDRFHPVAWFGAAAVRLESVVGPDRVASPRSRRRWGVAHAAAGVLAGTLAGRASGTLLGSATVAIGGGGLERAALDVRDHLARGDLDGARAALPALVGRDPSTLDADDVARAVVESVAENLVDAVVAPVWWGLVSGAPGMMAYRAVNTMDAMIGHRSERYVDYGRAAARLDDAAGWIPARLTAVLVAVVSPGRRADVWRCVRRDGPRHPSPNAGVAEAAAAGALGIRLGGPLRYGDRDEVRPLLGDGAPPTVADIARVVSLARRVTAALVVGSTVLALVPDRRP